jgi:hypothetical protein
MFLQIGVSFLENNENSRKNEKNIAKKLKT